MENAVYTTTMKVTLTYSWPAVNLPNTEYQTTYDFWHLLVKDLCTGYLSLLGLQTASLTKRFGCLQQISIIQTTLCSYFGASEIILE